MTYRGHGKRFTDRSCVGTERRQTPLRLQPTVDGDGTLEYDQDGDYDSLHETGVHLLSLSSVGNNQHFIF